MARVSKELAILIKEIQIEFIKKGKRPPSTKKITKLLATKVKKSDILHDEYIRFR